MFARTFLRTGLLIPVDFRPIIRRLNSDADSLRIRIILPIVLPLESAFGSSFGLLSVLSPCFFRTAGVERPNSNSQARLMSQSAFRFVRIYFVSPNRLVSLPRRARRPLAGSVLFAEF